MSKKVKFEIDQKGMIEFFKSAPVQGWLQECGDYMAGIATDMAQVEDAEYGARAHVADRTAIANVYPNNKEAGRDNYDNNTLLKAKGASGFKQSK